MFYSVGIFRTSSPGGSISSNPEKTTPRMRRGEPGFIDVLQLRAGSREHQKIIVNWTRYPQLRNLALFYMRKCKSLSSLKSFLWYAPQLSGASILYFHILSFLRAHWLTLEGWNCWGLWHPLFTDMAGNIPFLISIYLHIYYSKHEFMPLSPTPIQHFSLLPTCLFVNSFFWQWENLPTTRVPYRTVLSP